MSVSQHLLVSLELLQFGLIPSCILVEGNCLKVWHILNESFKLFNFNFLIVWHVSNWPVEFLDKTKNEIKGAFLYSVTGSSSSSMSECKAPLAWRQWAQYPSLIHNWFPHQTPISPLTSSHHPPSFLPSLSTNNTEISISRGVKYLPVVNEGKYFT